MRAHQLQFEQNVKILTDVGNPNFSVFSSTSSPHIFSTVAEFHRYMTKVEEISKIIPSKDARVQDLQNISNVIRTNMTQVLQGKDVARHNLVCALNGKLNQVHPMAGVGVGNENENPMVVNSLLAQSHPRATVHDSVKQLLLSNKDLLKAPEKPQKFGDLSDITGMLNDKNQGEELQVHDSSFQTFIKPKKEDVPKLVPDREVEEEDEEAKVSILSDLPIRDYSNMNSKFTITEDDIQPDGKALRLPTIDGIDGHTVLKVFLKIPGVVPFMISTKQKYCSSFIFYNTNTHEIIKRVDLCENISHPLLSISNIGSKWFFLQRENTNCTIRNNPRCYLFKLVMIDAETSNCEVIYKNYSPERKVIMAASSTRLYIAFLNKNTVIYDVVTSKWQKVPGLKLNIKGNAMLNMQIVTDSVLYVFWTGFSTEFGNNIYYLKLAEGEFWKQISVEVDERTRQ